MKKYILPLILILLLTFTLAGYCWVAGYDQRIKLTIDHTKIDSNLSNFPVTAFFLARIHTVLTNPNPGDLVDELVMRFVVNNKVYFGSHRAQGPLQSNGHEYYFEDGEITTIATIAGIAAWHSVYDSALQKIYPVGEAWDSGLGALRASTHVIDTTNDNVSSYLIPNTGDCNELIGLLDDGDNLIAGERAAGGTTTGSSYVNGGGLWTIPKATISNPATYTRVYQDPGNREWRNIVKMDSTYFALLGAYTNGSYIIVSSTNLTEWETVVDGSTLTLNDLRGSILYDPILDRVFVTGFNSDRDILLHVYDGESWTDLNTNITAASTGTIFAFIAKYDNNQLLLGVDNEDGTCNFYFLDPTTANTQVIASNIMGSNLLYNYNNGYFSVIHPGKLMQLGCPQGEEVFAEFDADEDFDRGQFALGDGTLLKAEKELFEKYQTKVLYLPEKSGTGNPAIAYKVFSAVDCTDLTKANGTLKIDLKCSNPSILSGDNRIEIASSGERDVNEWSVSTPDGITTDYQTFEIPLTDAETQGGELNVSAINFLRWYHSTTGDDVTLYWRNASIVYAKDKAVWHVKLPTISSSADTEYYFYYDNDAGHNTAYIGIIGSATAAEVWDEWFSLVVHGVDNTTSSVLDSTSNNNDSTKASADNPIQVDGQVGKAQDFSSDYLSHGIMDLGSTNITIEAIVKIDAYQAGSPYISTITGCEDAAPVDNVALLRFGDATLAKEKAQWILYVGGETKLDGAIVNPTAEWFHVCGTYDGINMRLYIDSVQDTYKAQAGSASTNDIYMTGRRSEAADRYLDGKVDEVRYSTCTRNAAWIKATYNSLWDTLLTYGSEEISGWSHKWNTKTISKWNTKEFTKWNDLE